MTEIRNDRELGWEDQIQQDSTESVVLEPGDYIFEITGFERARYTPGPNSKLPACNMAKLTMKIETPQGVAYVNDRLYLHTSTEGLLSAFFAGIGQKKKDQTLNMNWGTVIGSKGAVKIKNRNYNGSKFNEVARYYPSDSSYYEDKPMPEIVKQVQVVNPFAAQPQAAQPTYQQPVQPQQPTQPTNNQAQGYTPGAF